MSSSAREPPGTLSTVYDSGFLGCCCFRGVSPVTGTLPKKEASLTSVNEPLLKTWTSSEVEVVIRRADEAEVDERWSFVGKKQVQRWLWHAIDHCTGKALAYVCGRRQDTVFLKLKALLEPFGITRYHTDYWGASTRHLDAEEHNPGKRNTQKIERKQLICSQ